METMSPMSTPNRERLLATLAENRDVAELSPSPFYVELLERMTDCVRSGGPTWDLLAPYAGEPATEYYPFRALAGVHHEVLSGARPGLAARYPSAGGDGDAAAAWPEVREAFAAHDPDVLADLRHPLQTNETSRCGALIGGFCAFAAETGGMPLRALELGSSAGLNLHLDRYRYEADGLALGPADSPVRFRDYWEGGTPAFDASLEIVERRGCDIDPIDVTSDEGRLMLQSYIWPDQVSRLETLRGAISVAGSLPVGVEGESADTWLAARLAESPDAGAATLVFHSVFWVYVPDPVRAGIVDALESASARATTDAPLGWLRYEESTENPREVELRLTTWPGGTERLLAVGRHHLHPLRWLG